MRVLRGVVYLTKSSGPRTESYNNNNNNNNNNNKHICIAP